MLYGIWALISSTDGLWSFSAKIIVQELSKIMLNAIELLNDCEIGINPLINLRLLIDERKLMTSLEHEVPRRMLWNLRPL